MIKEIASPPAADRNDYKTKKAGRARLIPYILESTE
jgi:hypothetical protein